MTLSKRKVEFTILLFSLLTYAMLSSPFPRNPSLAELMIGFLMALFVGLPIALVVFTGAFTILDNKIKVVPVWLYMVFFYLLYSGLMVGMFRSTDTTDVIRDLIPLIYLYMPLLLLPKLGSDPEYWSKKLLILIVAIGLIYSYRYYQDANVTFSGLGKQYYSDFLMQFPFDAGLQFAGAFLLILGLKYLLGTRFKKILIGIAITSAAFFVIGTYIGVVQRAPLGLTFLVALVYLFLNVKQKPITFCFLLILLLAGVINFKQDISYYLNLFLLKQQMVGTNGKITETIDILKTISQSPMTFLFGYGLGGVYKSPTTAIEISFTHSVFSYFFIKSGVIGFFLNLSYLVWVLKQTFFLIKTKYSHYILAAAVPLIIGSLFQPSYKTFSFGLVLCLILTIAHLERSERLQREI